MLATTTLAIIGIIVGYFVGIVGIGAGVLLMPLLLWHVFTLAEAVAAGLFLQVVPQSLPALYVYYTNNNLKLWECIVLALGSALGMYFGAWVTNLELLSKRTLYCILCGLMTASTAYVFYNYVWKLDT